MSDAVRDAHSLLRKWSTSELIDRLTDDPLLTSVTRLPLRKTDAPVADPNISRSASQPDSDPLPETESPPVAKATVGPEDLTIRDRDDIESAIEPQYETESAIVANLPASDSAEPKSDSGREVFEEPQTSVIAPSSSECDIAAEPFAMKPTPSERSDVLHGQQDTDQPSVAVEPGEVGRVEVGSALPSPDESFHPPDPVVVPDSDGSTPVTRNKPRRNIDHHEIRRRKIPRRDLSGAGNTGPEVGGVAAIAAGNTIVAAATTATPTIPLNSDAGNRDVKRNLRIDTPTSTAAAADTSSAKLRFDAGSNVDGITATHGSRRRTQGKKRSYRVDAGHQQSDLEGPHYEIETPARSSVNILTGQFLAYLGVLGLTVGTAIVIYGHFGGYAEYTPTGWLITTVAQMMLFLGVINLVSGGMEQTSDEMSHRIDSLSHQLLRIEEYADELRGPKIPASRYAAAEAEAEDYAAEREQVGA